MWTKVFWKDVTERVIATVAQVLLGILTADGFNLVAFDVVGVLTMVGVAAAAVVLKSLVAINKDNTISPASLVPNE